MKKLIIISFFLGAASLLPIQFASATPFSNGNFETGTATGGNEANGSGGNIPSWVVGDVGYLEFNFNGQNSQDAQSGSQFISFGHNSNTGETLSQTFDTMIGQIYSVTYYVSQIQAGGNDNQTMSLTAFDDSMIEIGFVDTIIPTVQNQWVLGTTLTFVAASASTTLEFLDTTNTAIGGGGSSNWALDTVTVTTGSGPSVPEGGPTMSLLAISLMGLLFFRRRSAA